MKTLAYVANTIFILLIGYVSVYDAGRMDAAQWAGAVALILLPTINILALRQGKSSLIGTWLKRKRLEEERRIEEIS